MNVLHLMHTWGSPSETFVRRLVLGVPECTPIVVCERSVDAAPAPLPVIEIGGILQRAPARLAGKLAVACAVLAGRRARVDLVHAHMLHEVLLARRVALLLHRPLMVALHGRDLLVEAAQHPEALRAVRQADAVVVPSPFLAEAAVDRGVSAERIAIIPSGVDLEEIPMAPRPVTPGAAPLVLFVGRFVEKKGVLAAAQAVVRAARLHPVRARFVGDGPLRDALVEELGPLGAAGEVLDGRDRATVVRALAEADVLVSPSRTAPDGDAETLLVVNLEAQAAGLPIVTAAHGGIPSALGRGAAVVIDEADDDALEQALADLLARPGDWAAMGRAGRAHVEAHHRIEVTLQRTRDLYESLRHGKGVPVGLRWEGRRPLTENPQP